MKIGCCLNMNAQDKFKIGYEDIPVIRDAGFDYAELPLAQVMDLSESEFTVLLTYIKENGLPVASCNNFFPPQIRLTGDNAKISDVLEYAKHALERAARLGVSVIVLGSAGAKNIPKGFSREKARAQFIRLLSELQDIAKALNITIALEPLNTEESNFITTAEEGLLIVHELRYSHIKLLIDYYHLRMENESLAVIGRAGQDLVHIHLASKEGRRFPAANDGENYNAFMEALIRTNYKGNLSVEAYSKNLAKDALAALSVIY